jgi:hypothetical protein
VESKKRKYRKVSIENENRNLEISDLVSPKHFYNCHIQDSFENQEPMEDLLDLKILEFDLDNEMEDYKIKGNKKKLFFHQI